MKYHKINMCSPQWLNACLVRCLFFSYHEILLDADVSGLVDLMFNGLSGLLLFCLLAILKTIHRCCPLIIQYGGDTDKQNGINSLEKCPNFRMFIYYILNVKKILVDSKTQRKLL